MIQINLLPEKEKTEIKYTLRYRFIILFSIWFFICFLLFISILIFSNFYLSFQINSLGKELTVEKNFLKRKKVYDLENVSQEINQKLLKIEKIKKESRPIYDIFKSLALNLKNETKLKNIYYSSSQKKINLTGFALSRNDLLNLKDDLEKNKYFSSVNLPIYFLAQKTDINFSLNLKLK